MKIVTKVMMATISTWNQLRLFDKPRLERVAFSIKDSFVDSSVLDRSLLSRFMTKEKMNMMQERRQLNLSICL